MFINKSNLVEKITNKLREDIVSGIYPQGTLFNQEDLALKFNVSRTPIKESLNQLENEGFVERHKKRQFMVKKLNLKYLIQIYQVREVIDGLSARIVAEQESSENVKKLGQDLDKILEKMGSIIHSWDHKMWTQLNVDFHANILKATNNRLLVDQLPLLRISSEMFYPTVKTHPKRALSSLDEHYMILKAICSGDGALAENIARTHIKVARKFIEESIL